MVRFEYKRGSEPVWFIKPGAKAHILSGVHMGVVYGLCDEGFLYFEVELVSSVSPKRQCKKCLRLWEKRKVESRLKDGTKN